MPLPITTVFLVMAVVAAILVVPVAAWIFGGIAVGNEAIRMAVAMTSRPASTYTIPARARTPYVSPDGTIDD